MRFRLGLAAVVSVLFTLPAWAHHSHGNYVDSFTDISGTVKEVLDVKSVREANAWDQHTRIEDVMDLESFVHLRTRIWKSLREEHAGTDH